MVKRILSLCFVLVLLGIFCLPTFAVDNFQSDTDTFGFAYNDSKIYFFNKDLDGFALSVEDQILPATRMYLFVPCTTAPSKMEVYYSFLITTGAIKMTACDYGTIYSNSYHITASLPVPTLLWIGTSNIGGSSARYFSCKSTFNSLPFTDSVSGRYIRMTIDVDPDYATALNLVTYLQKNLTQNMSGVLGNPTYTFSGTNTVAYGRTTGGSLSSDGYYITGSKKYKYYDGSTVKTDSLNLTNGTSGSGGYLRVPSHNIVCDASHQLTFTINASGVSGTLTPSEVSQNTDLQGTYLDRTYVSTVSMNASRQYDDSDLIDAVNDASDRNHTDLSNISDQMQEIIDHQQGLEQQGQAINGTTSQSTINNTSSTVNSGTSAVSNMAGSVASNVNSTSSEYTGYLGFLGDGMEVMFNHLQPLYIWFGACFLIPMILWMFRHATSGGDD